MAARVMRSYPTLAGRPFSLMVKIRELLEDRDMVLDDLASLDVDRELLANFHEDAGRYYQDRVKPLGDVLEEGRLDPYWMVDRYVQSIRMGWANGFAETSFNFTVNHGLNARGRVVIIDVGELSFDRREIEHLVAERFWERAFSPTTLPESVRGYLFRAMDRDINLDRLSREWSEARPIDRPHPAPDRPAARRHAGQLRRQLAQGISR
ncbi:MAG: hypothetical protein HKN29_04035 [Rhodothermales bacterium]|nr:hypothetical protein [Rhodothermales bacterium]